MRLLVANSGYAEPEGDARDGVRVLHPCVTLRTMSDYIGLSRGRCVGRRWRRAGDASRLRARQSTPGGPWASPDPRSWVGWRWNGTAFALRARARASRPRPRRPDPETQTPHPHAAPPASPARPTCRASTPHASPSDRPRGRDRDPRTHATSLYTPPSPSPHTVPVSPHCLPPPLVCLA